MTFAHPGALVAALLAALAVALLWRTLRRRAAADALVYSDLPFLVGALGAGARADRWLGALFALAAFALGVALAAPRVVLGLPTPDATVVVCVDTSGSMASTDVAPTRAAAAAEAVRRFTDGAAAGTRIGLVAFAGAAGVVGPPTADREQARAAVDRLPPPNGGTAIGDALASAAALLPAHGARAIVVVTDGVNNAGRDPLDEARRIGAAGVRIETVGIGTNGSGALIPGTAEAASIDEDALRAIAAEGRGGYSRAADAAALGAQLGALARTTTFERRRVDVALPLALAGGLLALGAAVAGAAAGRIP